MVSLVKNAARLLGFFTILLGGIFIEVVYCESIFLPPQNGELYSKSTSALNDSEYWRIKIFGLRMVPLDPTIWAVRRFDRTDNRRLVPMRPYFLRESEDPTFALDKIDLIFQLSKVSKQEANRVPFRRDALLEIEFGGRFLEGRSYTEPLIDEAYGVRFSAFPQMPSGIYFRSRNSTTMLKEFIPEQIDSGIDHRAVINFDDSGVKVVVGEKLVGEVRAQSLRRGLVSFETGWHPVTIRELTLVGTTQDSRGDRTINNFSGLITLPKSAPPKSRKGAQK